MPTELKMVLVVTDEVSFDEVSCTVLGQLRRVDED